jgi:hypothetical protein
MKAVGKNAGILRCALNDNEGHTSLWPSCYLASEMMEGENVYCLTNAHGSKAPPLQLK